MQNLLGLLLTLTIAAPAFANNCEFKAEKGDIPAETAIREEVSSNGAYLISYADASVEGYPWSNMVLVKNIDGSIPTSGTIHFPKLVTKDGWWRSPYSMSFNQKIKGNQIIHTNVFVDSGYKGDSFTSIDTLNSDDNSLTSIDITEVLKERSDVIPLFINVSYNKMKCTF